MNVKAFDAYRSRFLKLLEYIDVNLEENLSPIALCLFVDAEALVCACDRPGRAYAHGFPGTAGEAVDSAHIDRPSARYRNKH